MRITVIGPVKNEAQFIGYSIMAVLPYVHEIIYACAQSDDGTDEILDYIKDKHAGDKLTVLRGKEFDFDVKDMAAYNDAFNACIRQAKGDACWFLHPDMICLNPEVIKDMPSGPFAWWTNITSYAKDFSTVISSGRTDKWKNIHLRKFGLHYYGGYGSQNEDMYFSDITGKEHLHYGDKVNLYPYLVGDSGLWVNHYCELKDFRRRYEKMKACLRTLYPGTGEAHIEHLASNHPRVTLELTSKIFGEFEFTKTDNKKPEVFSKYKEEFDKILGVPA